MFPGLSQNEQLFTRLLSIVTYIRPMLRSYKNPSIDSYYKSINWFLHDFNIALILVNGIGIVKRTKIRGKIKFFCSSWEAYSKLGQICKRICEKNLKECKRILWKELKGLFEQLTILVKSSIVDVWKSSQCIFGYRYFKIKKDILPIH